MTVIRRARVDEAARLTALALRSKALWGYDEAFMAACIDELTVHPEDIRANKIWVGEMSARGPGPDGLYELIIADDGSRTAELRLLFIEPAAKGTGLGGALWRHAEALAKARGVTRIGLDADPFARPFYQHMGCVVVGRSPSATIPGRYLPRMEKTLALAGDL